MAHKTGGESFEVALSNVAADEVDFPLIEWFEVASEVVCFHHPQRVQVDAATELLDLLVAVFALIL